MIRLASSFLLGLVLSTSVSGLEIQSLVRENCERVTGLIVHVSETEIVMTDLGGRSRQIAINDVQTVYTYNVLENPFSSLHLDTGNLPYLKEIYLDDGDQPQALGWPVRFIEDLVIFFSLDGRSHVHSLADIYKLRPAPEKLAGTKSLKNFKAFEFEVTELSTQCSSLPKRSSSGVKPTRILADRISIEEFFNSFRNGYERLAGYQERTYLYAKPFLFDRNTRLGFGLGGQRKETQLNFPLYMQWSTGQPYQFQSFNVIGGKMYEFGPNTEPVFTLRSDVKSHIFHGAFIGNVLGIPAGESIYVKRESVKLKGDVVVQPAFNYMALMGGDFGPLSASTGLYYPTFGIKIGDEEREVLGSSATYALRFMFTKKHYRLRLIGAMTRYRRNSPTADDVLSRQNGILSASPPVRFEFENVFLHGGFDWEFNDRIAVAVDGIINKGRYEETVPLFVNDLDYFRLTIQPMVRLSFGDYVAVTGYANFNNHTFNGNFMGGGVDKTQRETTFLGAFEFIF